MEELLSKLIDLLNEYEKEIKKSEFYEWEKWVWWDTNLFRRDTRDEEWSHLYSDTADTYVISKKYGFIWWLVDNDKIDISRIEYKYQDAEFELENADLIEWKSDFLIMLCSIQSNPISFLISILK